MRVQESRCSLVEIAAAPPSAVLISAATASTTVVTLASHPSTASAAASKGGTPSVPPPSSTILPGGGCTRFRHPVGPRHIMPRSFTGGLEDTPRSLLAAGLAAQPVCICDDHLHNSGHNLLPSSSISGTQRPGFLTANPRRPLVKRKFL